MDLLPFVRIPSGLFMYDLELSFQEYDHISEIWPRNKSIKIHLDNHSDVSDICFCRIAYQQRCQSTRRIGLCSTMSTILCWRIKSVKNLARKSAKLHGKNMKQKRRARGLVLIQVSISTQYTYVALLDAQQATFKPIPYRVNFS